MYFSIAVAIDGQAECVQKFASTVKHIQLHISWHTNVLGSDEFLKNTSYTCHLNGHNKDNGNKACTITRWPMWVL